MKLGLCEKCAAPSDATYEIRSNRVYLVKFCKNCGRSASLVSKDARKWRWKRDLADYQEPLHTACSLNCASCDHQAHTAPNTVAIDVTNLCNQRCPICLAYVDAMGFAYHPPLEYFDKIFQRFQHQEPKPNICFFGGEPTVHADFLDIVRRARSYGFKVQLFTNGIKLADRNFCQELCSLGVQVNLGIDGTRPDVYKALRGDNSLAVKRKAFANVIECGVNRLAVITTLAEGINDDNMPDMMQFIHEHRDHVSVWAFVPLTPCWEAGKVNLEPTTTECVEAIFERTVDGIEFVPTCMMDFSVLSRFFGRQTLGGSHPNCESATLLVSDGTQYVPISRYLKVPLSELLRRLRRADRGLALKQAARSGNVLSRWALHGEAALRTVGVIGKGLDLPTVFGQRWMRNAALSLLDIVRGRTVDEVLRKRTAFQRILTLLTSPYEDQGGLEDARLKDCPAVFAYEDVSTGQIRTAAFCSWQTIKDDVCRKIQSRYDAKTAVSEQARSAERA